MCPAEHGPCEDPQTAFNHQLQLATHRLIGVVRSSVSELLWYTWTLESWLECAETLTGLSTRGSVPARVYPLIARLVLSTETCGARDATRNYFVFIGRAATLPGFDSSLGARARRGSARRAHGHGPTGGRGRCGAERRAVPDRARAAVTAREFAAAARGALWPGWCECTGSSQVFSSY